MTWKVYVDGQEGTTGLRIHELLARRSDIEMLRIDADRRKDVAERARLLNAADVAFLCLPDVAAREAAALVANPRTCVIDASTAHRTAEDWAFGLPELTRGQRDRLRQAKRITNPGCHATGFILLIRPLIEAGVLGPTTALTAQSITGYSGGGRKMIEQYETAARDPRLSAPRPYGLSLAHKHIPEMMARTGLLERPIFMPIVASFYKGLAVSVPLHLKMLGTGIDAAGLHKVLRHHYEGEPFVRVLPLSDPANLDDGYLDVQGCNDTNRCDLYVFGNNADQVILMARLDNLGKGASGAAVQSMNVHLGVEEGLGL